MFLLFPFDVFGSAFFCFLSPLFFYGVTPKSFFFSIPLTPRFEIPHIQFQLLSPPSAKVTIAQPTTTTGNIHLPF